jgi:hypothetical protein
MVKTLQFSTNREIAAPNMNKATSSLAPAALFEGGNEKSNSAI